MLFQEALATVWFWSECAYYRTRYFQHTYACSRAAQRSVGEYLGTLVSNHQACIWGKLFQRMWVYFRYSIWYISHYARLKQTFKSVSLCEKKVVFGCSALCHNIYCRMLNVCEHLTLTLPGPSAGVSGSLDSYCSLKPLCLGMGEVVPARTSPTLLPHPLALCCHFPVSKCCSASIAVTGTVRVKLAIWVHLTFMVFKFGECHVWHFVFIFKHYIWQVLFLWM